MKFFARKLSLTTFLILISSTSLAAQQPDLVVHGEISSISDSSLTVESVRFHINGETDYVDENGQSSNRDRFSVGDFVEVAGMFVQEGILARRVELKHDHLPPPPPPGDNSNDDDECFQGEDDCEDNHNPIHHIEGIIQEISQSSVRLFNKVFAINGETILKDKDGAQLSLIDFTKGNFIEIVVSEENPNYAIKLIKRHDPEYEHDGDIPDGDDLSGPPLDAETIGAIQSIGNNIVQVLNRQFRITEFSRIEAHGGRPADISDLRTGLLVRIDGIDNNPDDDDNDDVGEDEHESEHGLSQIRTGEGDPIQLARRIEIAHQVGNLVKVRGPISIIFDEDITVRGVSARFMNNTEIRDKHGEIITRSELRTGMLVKLLVEVAEDFTLRANKIRVEGHVVRPDFDDDGEFEKVVYRPEAGMWFIHYGSDKDEDGQVDIDTHSWGLPSDIPILMEIDGDGRNEIAVYRPSTGQWFVRLSSTGYKLVRTIQWGLPGDLPVPGDYDCDGITDVGVYRPGFGLWFILLSSGNDRSEALEGNPEYILTRQWGLPTHLPVTGADRDGDCRDDIVVWDKNTGYYFTLYSSSGYNRSAALAGNLSAGDMVQFGLPGDDPLVGDFDGDGKDDLSVFRNGEWFVKYSSGAQTFAVRWGLEGDIPSVLDPTLEDEDQRSGLSVYRPSSGTHFDLSAGGELNMTQWGLPTDIPVGNKKRQD